MNLTLDKLQDIIDPKLNFQIKKKLIILATTFNSTILGDHHQHTQGSPYEWLQIFDDNDEPYLVEGHRIVLYRKECHGINRLPNVWHRAVNGFILDEENNVLLPRRAKNKDLYPGMIDISVAEHLKVGESYIEGLIRGFQEEQNMAIDKSNIQFLCKFPIRNKEESEMNEYYVYRMNATDKPQGSSEIQEQQWVPLSDLKDSHLIKEFIPSHMPALEALLDTYNR